MPVIEAKVGVVAGSLVAITAVGAWSSRFVAAALQSSGIVVETSVLVQLVMTAVIVGIAFGMVRTKVDAMARRFDSFERALDDIGKKVERFDEKLNNHGNEIDRLRGHRQGHHRHPTSDAEDV